MNKKTVRDVDVKGKKVLVRCDFNVPLDENGRITDENRIMGALPTIKYLMEHGAKVIMCSHLGKPHNIFTEGFGLTKKEKKAVEALPAESQAAAKAEYIEKAKAKDPKKFTLRPLRTDSTNFWTVKSRLQPTLSARTHTLKSPRLKTASACFWKTPVSKRARRRTAKIFAANSRISATCT